jgi:Tfp pilus assembly protein PilF
VNAVRQNTLGVAYLNQQDSREALARFRDAYAIDPSLTVARLNEAIAVRDLQQFDEARQILTDMTATEPENVRAWFQLGLVRRVVGETGLGADAFRRAVELDPSDPDSHYFLGTMLVGLQRYEDAILSFEEALRLNPFHVSAEYGLGNAYRFLGQVDEALEHLTRSTEMQARQVGFPVEEGYGQQGQYSTAADFEGTADEAPSPIPVRFVVADAGLSLTPSTVPDIDLSGVAVSPGIGACFMDYDDDGWVDVFLTGGPEGTGLFRNVDGTGFVADHDAGIGDESQSFACAAGDYDNSGTTDLVVSSPGRVALYQNDGGAFEEVSGEAGIEIDGLPLGVNFVDFDHDGDLDIYVARSTGEGTPNRLWRNNGNGTFVDFTSETALGGQGGSLGSLASDLDNDRAVDFVVSGPGAAARILLNPREGEFVPMSWPSSGPDPAIGLAAADFDKDGWIDLAFTHPSAPGVSLWRNVEGDTFEQVDLPEAGWTRGWGLAAVDYDNDGWVDLAVVGDTAAGGAIRLFRNVGTEGFVNVTSQVGLSDLDLIDPRGLVTADYDLDGDSDLLLTSRGGEPVLLRNDGGNANGSVRILPQGLADNMSGIGTKVEVFAGTHRQKYEVRASSGFLGQSSLALTAGIGANAEAETVRMLWPTGVLQDEVLLAASSRNTLVQIDRRGSSCPVLFAWNGAGYEFITDIIGAGIVGHWVGPGQRNVADPTEYVKVPGSAVALRDGMLSFKLIEPMEELVYLDEVRLLAIDHPAGVDVFPHEYFAAVAPFPEFDVIASAEPRLPIGAWDTDGRDVLSRISARDRQYVDTMRSTAFEGFAEPHTLELDLGGLPFDGPVRLMMHGFVDYFTATSVFAAHQAGTTVILPYVEARREGGEWVRVIDDLGFPAGLARTLTRDITGRLPEGTERIRITTNLKVYWDQILIDTAPEPAYRVSEVPLARANVGWKGYPLSVESATPGDVSYVYSTVSQTGPFARHAGYYTRYGDVVSLLGDADDRFVIFGSGDEISVEFDPATLPAVEAGWERDYFVYADGFAKDMDFYEAHASTVAPLPFHTGEAYPYLSGASHLAIPGSAEYQLEYNTRGRSGQTVSSYRFDYEE